MSKESTCLEAIQGYWSEYSAQMYNVFCSSFKDIFQGNPYIAMESNIKALFFNFIFFNNVNIAFVVT